MMFWKKRKRIIKNMQEEISVLKTRQFKLRRQVTELEQKTKYFDGLHRHVKQLEQRVTQHECKHNFKFDNWDSLGIGGPYYVCHKCTECDKATIKNWDSIAKKGQQALKLLNLVPKDWKIKGDK